MEVKKVNGKQMTLEDIQDWLVQYVSDTLEIPTANIDLDESFKNLGFDSISAVELSEKIGSFLNLEEALDPTVTYDYTTINQLSGYLENLTK
ncbi:MAG: acyl carrier protein [Bacteroidota bacterium]